MHHTPPPLLANEVRPFIVHRLQSVLNYKPIQTQLYLRIICKQVFIVKDMPKINAKPRTCKQTFGDPCQFIEI